jgi:hypothetical protein
MKIKQLNLEKETRSRTQSERTDSATKIAHENEERNNAKEKM